MEASREEGKPGVFSSLDFLRRPFAFVCGSCAETYNIPSRCSVSLVTPSLYQSVRSQKAVFMAVPLSKP
jgi:hypothetical protein